MTDRTIEFDLVGNAEDSLRQAVHLIALKQVDDTGLSDQSRLKHAITASAHCIELLLKEALRRIHPAFVWERVDTYPSLTARTVTVDGAIARLKALSPITLTPADETKLKALRTTRNAIEHYEWRTSEKQAKVIVGCALSFAIEFAKEHLKLDLVEQFRGDTWESFLYELNEFAIEHANRLESRFAAQDIVALPCETCGANTVPVATLVCELCGNWLWLHDDD